MGKSQKLRILFLSHTFPPIVGGVETQNYELFTWLSKIADVKLVANRKRWLIPIFLPYAAIRALVTIHNYDVLLLGSCILGNAGWLVKILTKKPVIAVAHGLDLTWKNKIYQKFWIGIFLKKIDKFIAVGNETIRAGVARGLPEDRFIFVPNGVDTEKHVGNFSRQDLEKVLGESLDGKKVILTSGRLARRKGVAWFIENVLPKLEKNILYVVAGDGVDRENIESTIKKCGMQDQVRMLGYVSDEHRNILMNTSDLFVQPNIKVAGDMEGFGISVIEAVSCRLPLVASDLEGLKDAIKDGQNGFLIAPQDADGYVKKITELLGDEAFRRSFGEKARQYVVENYSWDKISQRYLDVIRSVIR